MVVGEWLGIERIAVETRSYTASRHCHHCSDNDRGIAIISIGILVTAHHQFSMRSLAIRGTQKSNRSSTLDSRKVQSKNVPTLPATIRKNPRKGTCIDFGWRGFLRSEKKVVAHHTNIIFLIIGNSQWTSLFATIIVLGPFVSKGYHTECSCCLPSKQEPENKERYHPRRVFGLHRRLGLCCCVSPNRSNDGYQ